MAQHIKNVAVVGAGGQIGGQIVNALLEAGNHKVTAITRSSGGSSMPSGVAVKTADYNDHASLVEALKGQDALVITMSPAAPRDIPNKLVDAAADAGVAWIIPNEWGIDAEHDTLGEESMLAPGYIAHRQHILSKNGKTNFVAVTCSFWYEFSLGGVPEQFGFDVREKKLVYFDDGTAKISTTTWPQCARTVARILSLPVSGASPCLNDYKNKPVYVSSFAVSQKDMFESVKRVTGTTDSDWTISHVSSKEAHAAGVERVKKGDYSAIVKVMYARVFFPNGGGNMEDHRTLDNEKLGLPKEDLDEATKVGIEMGMKGNKY